jgi:hypothetical protein
MRLTLRTLLAWLDTVLPPAEQQALGEKVAASPIAPQLIARIRDVVERPVLAAPRPDARGIADEANSVAEYLDNTLPADRLETFERICIESDMHLAEVAACHGMLAEIARDPEAAAPLDPASRRRLLEAIRHQIQAPHGDAEHEAAVSLARSLRAALVAGGDGEPCDTVLGSPPVVRPRSENGPRQRAPWAAWLSAAVALLLLAALGGFLVWSVGRDRGRKVAARPAPPPAVVAATADDVAPQPSAEPVAAPAVQPAEQMAVAPPVAAAPEPAAVSSTPTPPVEEPPAAVPAIAAVPPAPAPVVPAPPPAEQPRVPQGDALAIAAPAPAGEPAVVVGPPAGGPPPAAPEPIDDGAGFVSGAALLLHKAAAEPAVHGHSGWAALPQNSPLAPREDLIAPPFCRPEVSVGGVTIRLESNTRATLTHDADGAPRLEVVFGRAIVRSSAAEPRLGITAGGLVGVVTDGLRAPLGVEVTLEQAPGADPATTPARVQAVVATTTSGIAWRQSQADGTAAVQPLQGIAAQGVLEKDSRLAWDSLDPGGVAVQARRESPDWLAGTARPDRLEQAAADALAGKAAADPIEKGLRELADDRRAENRVAAVATLALLGDYDELVALLSAEAVARKLEDRQWSRLVDMTVPLALARGANAAARLGQAFETRGPAGKGAELFAIARGFDDATLEAGGDARLVAALDAPELVVRRFAIRSLLEAVQLAEADRARYRPDRSQDLRRESVAWWRKQLADGRIRRPAGGAAR